MTVYFDTIPWAFERTKHIPRPIPQSRLRELIKEISGDKTLAGAFAKASGPEGFYKNGICVGSPDEVARTMRPLRGDRTRSARADPGGRLAHAAREDARVDPSPRREGAAAVPPGARLKAVVVADLRGAPAHPADLGTLGRRRRAGRAQLHHARRPPSRRRLRPAGQDVLARHPDPARQRPAGGRRPHQPAAPHDRHRLRSSRRASTSAWARATSTTSW